MSEKKAAILNISKALLGVSLTTLAAIGSATGNVVLAGLTALPGASLAALDQLGPQLSRKHDEQLELPMPPWWTRDAASWQNTCATIEQQLPAIMTKVAAQLRATQSVPTTALVRQRFVDEVAQVLPSWDVSPQERGLVATSVTPPILEHSALVLKQVIDPVRDEAIAHLLNRVAATLAQVATQGPTVAVAGSVTPDATAPTTRTDATATAGTTTGVSAVAEQLQRKVESRAYDVYVCYHEADEAEVLQIGDKLKAAGILPWLDTVDLQPGLPVRAQQEELIETIPAMAVCVGKQAIERGQALQIYAFIDQFVQRRVSVIPVLLGDAPAKLPPFLALFSWVDFRKRVPDPMGQLLWGITGKKKFPH
jgi:TIR domain-containing protein